MTEQERVDAINSMSIDKLNKFLEQLENNVIGEDEMLATAYAALIVVATLGYSPCSLAADAEVGASRLLESVSDTISDETS